MEIQSGNGEEVTSVTPRFVSCAPSRLQVVASDDPEPREELQAARRIEKFDIPLNRLKEMFERPAAVSTVSTACLHFILDLGFSSAFHQGN